jgi:hypothetical protein
MSDLMRKPPVLPEERPSAAPDQPVHEATDGSNFRLHPLSGLLLIAVDNIFWGVELATFELAMPVSVVLSFLITGVGVTLVQRFLGRDGWGASLAKAFFCAVLAGVPWSIMGTAFGGFVLMAAGLSNFNRKGK